MVSEKENGQEEEEVTLRKYQVFTDTGAGTKFRPVAPEMLLNGPLAEAVDDCHWKVNVPVPPSGMLPRRVSGMVPGQIVWLSVMSLPVIGKEMVTFDVLEKEVHTPDTTLRLNQVSTERGPEE